jgi:hypothetical protein
VVLEVGNRTRSHATDLARQVDILPDDIRNFLQRWVIVQSAHEEVEFSPTSDDSNNDNKVDRNKKQDRSRYNEEDDYDPRVPRTPVSDPSRVNSSWSLSAWLSGSIQSRPISGSSFLPDCRSRIQTKHNKNSNNNSMNKNGNSRNSNSGISSNRHSQHHLDPLSCKEASGCSNYDNENNSSDQDRDRERDGETLSSRLWKEVTKQVKKLADPDMQLAGLI